MARWATVIPGVKLTFGYQSFAVFSKTLLAFRNKNRLKVNFLKLNYDLKKMFLKFKIDCTSHFVKFLLMNIINISEHETLFHHVHCSALNFVDGRSWVDGSCTIYNFVFKDGLHITETNQSNFFSFITYINIYIPSSLLY